MPDLVKNGHLYTIQPPLYRVYHDGVNKYFMTDKDVDEYIKKLKGKKFMKTRFKGLGECNPPDLAMVMNKDQRTLIQLTLKDCEEFEEMLSGLMGRDTDFKKDMLNSI